MIKNCTMNNILFIFSYIINKFDWTLQTALPQ